MFRSALILIFATVYVTSAPAKQSVQFITEGKHVPVKHQEIVGVIEPSNPEAKPPTHHLGEMKSELGEEDEKDYNAYPKYRYEYGVKDTKTGDHKSHWEMRDGDIVKGSYTLDAPDGTQRIVEYRADDKHGFKAIVKIIRVPDHHRIHYAGQEQTSPEGLGQQEQGKHHTGHSYNKLKRYD
ncbi:uncharacterized protein LOC129768058 [Toxorhynchites rutilus septentrionalis]|uniref:uncharacterized protein LOC129768058 n=1 Tax=Toxorhynchites rutilus septentrionalis TaxID=329112 RepID=UPI002479FD7E|nr:uncharacterized protein LOC129768058 [Toxorhynchites rutilus septentrionalis]